MNAELMAAIAGLALSAGFTYIPGLNVKYGSLSSEHKSLIMLGLLAAVAGGVYGLSCAGWASGWGIEVTCNQTGLQELIAGFFVAAFANQTAYKLLPEPEALRSAKEAR